MFEIPDKIKKAMDILIKLTEDIENEQRKQQTILVIHEIAKLHQDTLGDLIKPSK